MGGLSSPQLQWRDAPERLARPRGRCLPPQVRRADQGRPRHRQRRARPAEHVRRSAPTTCASTASRCRSSSSPTCSCTSPPVSSRRRATRRVDRPSSASSSIPTRVVPVGRLDADTTGAILLTNDGDLAHRLAHPKYEVDKVYVAELWQQPTDGILRKLADGVKLDEDGTKTAPAQVRRICRRRRRADDPRGPQPAGEAHVRSGRAPREARCTAARYGSLDVEGLEPGAVARARALRSRSDFARL